jgi:hypothetical protein
MNFSHKLRKLFDPDIICSLREHVHRAFHPINAHRFLEELEKDPSWEELRRKYPPGIKEMHRWVDARFWIKRNIERAQTFPRPWSTPSHPRSRLGPGYFLYVAQKLGHTGIGLDIDEHAIFAILCRCWVKRIVHRIQPRFHLPAPGKI